jgi:hypothetical protein
MQLFCHPVQGKDTSGETGQLEPHASNFPAEWDKSSSDFSFGQALDFRFDGGF